MTVLSLLPPLLLLLCWRVYRSFNVNQDFHSAQIFIFEIWPMTNIYVSDTHKHTRRMLKIFQILRLSMDRWTSVRLENCGVLSRNNHLNRTWFTGMLNVITIFRFHTKKSPLFLKGRQLVVVGVAVHICIKLQNFRWESIVMTPNWIHLVMIAPHYHSEFQLKFD